MVKLWSNLRHSLRLLLHRPGFTITVVLTLGLTIGATTAIFTVADAVLFRPLPFVEPKRLVYIDETHRRETIERRPVSYPDYLV